VQNRLEDLGALMAFLRIKPFDERGGFAQYIIAPFKMCDPEILPKLRLLVDSVTLRRVGSRSVVVGSRSVVVGSRSVVVGSRSVVVGSRREPSGRFLFA
jgi:hypothetical protein